VGGAASPEIEALCRPECSDTLILIVTKMNGDLRQGGRTAVCDTCPAVSKDITQTIRAKDEIEQEGVAVCYLRKLGNLRGVWSFRRRGCR
jgi:hypothetical protein